MNLSEELQDDDLIMFIENIKYSDIFPNNSNNNISKSLTSTLPISNEKKINFLMDEMDEIEDDSNIDNNLLNILKVKSGVILDKIPKIFTTLDCWIKHTNLKCWYCSLNFDSIPVFIPINVYKKNNILYQDVHGNFCSFNCAKSYINIYFANGDTFIYNNNLIKLYKIFNKKNIANIDISPPKFDMEIYGGYLTEDEYKNKISNLINHDYYN